MPTPKAHGGAALSVIPLTAPAFQGLNKEGERTVLGPEWATELRNTVLDDQNRVSAREGWNDITVTEPLYTGAAKTVTSITQTDGLLVTAASVAHGFVVGDSVLMAGASASEFNGGFIVGAATANTFDYTLLTFPTTTPVTGGITAQQIDTFSKGIEFRRLSGGSTFVVSAEQDAYESTDSGASWSSVGGGFFTGKPDVQFTHFNDELYVGMDNVAVKRKIAGAAFTTITPTFGAVPSSNGAILGAFGRLWVADVDNATIRYSGLLDATNWDTSVQGSGSIDTTSIWPDNDQIIAMAAHNGQLVIFGRDNIIIMDDSTGSRLGLDPANIFVVDVITGIGCKARHSIAAVGGDTWFLAQQGVTSLGRLIQEKSTPLTNISQNVQSYLKSFITATTSADIVSVYHSNSRFYLLSLPSAGSAGKEDGRVFAFDTRSPLPDGSFRCMGEWTGLVPKVIFRTRISELLYMSFRGAPGKIGLYNGRADNSQTYSLDYFSGWNDLGNPATLKIMKRAKGIFALSGDAAVTFKVSFDFNDTPAVLRVVNVSGGSISTYGGAFLYGGGSFYSGGVELDDATTNISGLGEFVKVGLSTTISGNSFSIQALSYATKLGRNII